MRLRPTLRASHLCSLGILSTALGIGASSPSIAAYGTAMLVGIALSRALTRVSVARARAAGFEMLWVTPQHALRARREHKITLVAELRNRDNLPTRFRGLHLSHSPGLTVSCTPQGGEVPANGRLRLALDIVGHRVGYHGIHNITLQTIRAPGLYTVPLSFSNPFVIEVLPHPIRLGLAGAIGGRSRITSPLSSGGSKNGDGVELREIREHRAGDPYRRIAWKASARRGRLLIIEKEEEQADTLWMIVEASVDSASGAVGLAALDQAIDRAANRLERHLSQGDRVGLAIVGTRILARVEPGHGPGHKARLLTALTLATHTADVDRSDWDENDVARRALEHMTALDARAATLRPYEHEKIAELASELLGQAPVQAAKPWSTSRNDSTLRRYLLSFGIQPPPRGVSDRHRSETKIGQLLLELHGQRRRPSIIYLFGHPPSFESPNLLLRALSQLTRRRTEVRFVPMLEPATVEDHYDESAATTPKGELVFDALTHRQRIAAEDGLHRLSRMGIKIVDEERSHKLQSKLAYYSRG